MENTLIADPKYNNLRLAKFINIAMHEGNKTAAQEVVYGALDIIKKETKKEPIEIFETAIENARPRIETRPRRVGGATYQVPTQPSDKRSEGLAMRWILGAAHKQKGKEGAVRLATELIAAANNQGETIRKKENTHKMAEANKAFAHLAR